MGMACKDEAWGIKRELREAERDQQRVGFFFFFLISVSEVEYLYDLTPTQTQK